MGLQYNPLLKIGLDNTGSGGGTGDVVGPASSTDNAITRFDGTTGKLLQNSTVTLDDSGNISGVNNLTATNAIILDSSADAIISIDRGTNGFNREAAIDFSTAGVTKYRMGLVQAHSGSDAFISIVDELSNELVKIEDKGSTAEMTVDTVIVSDEAYGAGWNGSLEVPTKNAVYDKIETTSVGAIEFIIDGGGSAITTGVKGDFEIPYACTINRVTLLSNESGSIVVDIWKDTYANYPPTGADSICASAKPTISSATKSQDSTLTGWTTSIAAGDTLRFNVDSVTTCTRVVLSLKVTKA